MKSFQVAFTALHKNRMEYTTWTPHGQGIFIVRREREYNKKMSPTELNSEVNKQTNKQKQKRKLANKRKALALN